MFSLLKKILSNYLFWLTVIIVFAFFIRTFDLANNPPAMYGDELTIVYDAYSILKTGHDQTGQFLPLTFKMGDGRPPFYVYATIPFVALFGPTAVGVRALSILSGLGIILITFFLTEILISKRAALFASFLLAISPWDIALSRGGFETHLALFLILLGIFSFIKAREKPFWLIFSALSLGLAIHTYHSYKVLVPLVIILLLFLIDIKSFFVKKSIKFLISSVLIFFILFSVWVFLIFNGSEGRFNNTNVFSNPDIARSEIDSTVTQRNQNNLPFGLNNLFYNKYVFYAGVLEQNYIDNISLSFLFSSGDRNPRHNPFAMGELYLAQFFLILIALLTKLNQHKKLMIFLIGCILISPIPTSVVSNGHALRSSFLLFPLTILSTMGMETVIQNYRRFLKIRIFLAFIIAIFLLQFIWLIGNLFYVSGDKYANFWSFSAKKASTEALENRQKFNYIFLSTHIDNMEFAYPTYAAIDPELVIAENRQPKIIGKYSFKQFENIYLGAVPNSEVNDFIAGLSGNVLYIGEADALKEVKNYDTINGLNNQPALIKVEK
ncbi:MAG: glycosyltransferase family 39 protein [Microgenomates group bacterium]|jgi:4-amino-4-deoxy-L-arabinose transferase-like glycosyltransferase